ncbi:MAG: hypothetical protein AB7P16_23515 [Bradyrhizobium sp.]|uniref:hypothetical protein n=1 Tax=Bradyrhizobium sp. TaxID=376 RepID=UPI003D0A8068
MFTVTVPAADPTLLSLAEIRSVVGADFCSEEDLRSLNASISAAIARYCRVADDGVRVPTLRLETVTEAIRFCRTREIVLKRFPVTEITSIELDGTDLVTADYELNVANGMLSRLCDDRLTWWSGSKLAVSYKAGHATVPADLKLAAKKLALVMNSESGREPGLKRENIPGVIEREYWVAPNDDPAFPVEVQQLLDPFVNPVLG